MAPAWTEFVEHAEHIEHLLTGCDCCEPITPAQASAYAAEWVDLRAAVRWAEGDSGTDDADTIYGSIESRLIDLALAVACPHPTGTVIDPADHRLGTRCDTCGQVLPLWNAEA